MLSEKESNVAIPENKSKYNGSFKPEVASTKFVATREINTTAEGPVFPSVHTFPSTSNIRTQNAEEPRKDKNGKTEENKTMTSERTIDLKTEGKVSANGVQNARDAKRATKVDQLNSSRPSNPFAKPSSNQESRSLFDTLKKMKKADVQGK